MFKKSTRYHERIALEIPLQVNYSETGDWKWTENTLTEDITICGIGLMLSHPVEPKHLIHFSLPMPNEHRLFDFGKDQYDVWGIICYVLLVQPLNPGEIRLKVGAALVGDSPPESFQHDPTILYDLKPVLRSDSFWDFREQPRKTGPYMRSAEERREIFIKISLDALNEQGQIIESVEADTLNISESGMAVKANLHYKLPRYVLIKNHITNPTLLAKVRGAHLLDSQGNVRLHLEFISGKWNFE